MIEKVHEFSILGMIRLNLERYLDNITVVVRSCASSGEVSDCRNLPQSRAIKFQALAEQSAAKALEVSLRSEFAFRE
jgi:hypothetical protein